MLLHKKEEIIELGIGKSLKHPDLYIRRKDRIGLTGSNGSGKSTLINRMAALIARDKISFTYIPQEITQQQSEEILTEAKNPDNESKGMIFTIISRLNSDPKRLLESTTPSPGELRKLMLAQALLKGQELIIMDEPTNHMDLPSIKCVEEALQSYEGTLVLISHDMIFLNKIVKKHWEIEAADSMNYILHS